MGSDSWVSKGTSRAVDVTPPTIYTLGTSTRSLQEFVELLDSYAILGVVDVRRFPTSRHNHFRRENLEPGLEARVIKYVYLGDDLGGYRKGGYETHMASHAFNRGIEALVSLAKERSTVLICAERLPWKCHRRFIGSMLQQKGWPVVHLIEKDRIWTDKHNRKEGQGRSQ